MMSARDQCTEIPDRMRALRIQRLGLLSRTQSLLELDQIPTPRPGSGEVLIHVHYCGVCHTELDEIEGRTPPVSLPMTPGHQIIGTVVAEGPDCSRRLIGAKVGVAWIHSACGDCEFCRRGLENLCPDFSACGRDAPGGYADYLVADEPFVYPLPAQLDLESAAPLLCAGAVGYRALKLCDLDNGASLGLTGFGASGQLVLQIARHRFPDSPVFVFARSEKERAIAEQMGAAWTGDTQESPPTSLRAIIDTTPAWLPVLCALDALEPGGRLVVNAIRKESGDQDKLTNLDYARQLWMEKSLTSVANVTRKDVSEMLDLAASGSLEPRVTPYPLEQAEEALLAIRSGDIRAAGVLHISNPD
ncbi:alcohol dehydrogenase catalytic domain-containing protein [Elongatibacter sediminis]|uniref:alcohol dehydrogenase n=1 Tax=Elongatibacter sediminis TaxID=3119006 RepID=A0AAW9R898_9GAMM